MILVPPTVVKQEMEFDSSAAQIVHYEIVKI